MLFSLIVEPDRLVLMARGETGETVGDFIQEFYPDTPMPGKLTYAELSALGSGQVQISADWNKAKAVGRPDRRIARNRTRNPKPRKLLEVQDDLTKLLRKLGDLPHSDTVERVWTIASEATDLVTEAWRILDAIREKTVLKKFKVRILQVLDAEAKDSGDFLSIKQVMLRMKKDGWNEGKLMSVKTIETYIKWLKDSGLISSERIVCEDGTIMPNTLSQNASPSPIKAARC